MQKQLVTVLLILSVSVCGWAQDEDEKDIGTETVTVTKAYTPTISDAFKIKSLPKMNDSIVLQKKKIEYSIFSVPVASTFTPAKGTASKVKKIAPPALYNSYASAGVGNPANLMAKFYTSRTIDRESGYTVGLSHNSSRANIKSVEVDNFYSNSLLEGAYSKRGRDVNWGADIGVQHKLYNWYGTPEGFFQDTNNGLTADDVDTRQNYFMGAVGAHVNVEDSFFKRAEFKYRRFWDAVKSGENRIVLQPEFEFPIADEMFAFKFKADYVNGSFENNSLNSATNTKGINYSNFQIGVTPSLNILRDNLSLNLGLNFVYGLDSERNDGTFYIYPAVTASYRLLDDFAIAYAGAEGELKQHSYYDLVADNPYVSPTLTIVPTDKNYDAYLGLRGQLLPNLSYNVKGSYTAESRKALFKLNPINSFRNDEKHYYLGNSYEVFYDDLKTFAVFGELNIDVNRNFTLGVNAEYFSYNTTTSAAAWNLPDIEGSLFMDYQIGEKWYAGANLFYVGKRQDYATTVVPNTQPTDFPTTIIALDSYFDLNAHLGYRVTDQLSVFLKGANLANNNYQRWANFPVQGIQAMAGATYKFDL